MVYYNTFYLYLLQFYSIVILIMSREEKYSQLPNNNNNNTTEADASLRRLEIGNMITRSIYDVLFDSYKSENMRTSEKTAFCFEDGAFIFYDIGAQLFNLLYYANKDSERTPNFLGNPIISVKKVVVKKRRMPNPNFYKTPKHDVEKFSLHSVCKKLPNVCANIFRNEALTHLMPWLYKHKDITIEKRKGTPNLTGKFTRASRRNKLYNLASEFNEFAKTANDVDTIRIRFLDHPTGFWKNGYQETWGEWISLDGTTRARNFNNVNQMERIFEHRFKENNLCPAAGETSKPKGVIKFYHYEIQLRAGSRGATKTIPFTYVKFESNSFTHNKGHHKETNQKKTKAFQIAKGQKGDTTPLANQIVGSTFDLQPLSFDSKTDCFAKRGYKKICYRAEDITPPDDRNYDEWKADWNPEEDNFYKHLRTGQEFYVNQTKTDEIVGDIKVRIRDLQRVTRAERFAKKKRGGKRRKTRKRKKKKTRRKRRNRKKRTRKR